MLKRFTLVAFAFAAVSLLSARSASAGPFTERLGGPGPTSLRDESRGIILDLDQGGLGPGYLSVGDVVYGFFQIDTVGTPPGGNLGSNESVIGVYSVKVADIGAGGVIQFEATGSGTGSLQSLLGSRGELTLASNAVVAIFDNSGVGNPLSGVVDYDVAALIADINAGNGYASQLVLGLDGVDDFYQAKATTGLEIFSGGAFVPGNPLLIDDIENGFGQFANFSVGLSVTENLTPGLIYENVLLQESPAIPKFDFLGNTGEFQFISTAGTQSGAEGRSGFTFIDDGVFKLHAVPEPSSMILLGLGLSGVFGYGLRRRKAASVA